IRVKSYDSVVGAEPQHTLTVGEHTVDNIIRKSIAFGVTVEPPLSGDEAIEPRRCANPKDMRAFVDTDAGDNVAADGRRIEWIVNISTKRVAMPGVVEQACTPGADPQPSIIVNVHAATCLAPRPRPPAVLPVVL